MSSEQWLVRTAKNRITGPMSKAEVCELIKDGHLGPEDEVCCANRYWIALHEAPEVYAQLGVEVPKRKRDVHAERTLTQTDEALLAPEFNSGGQQGYTRVISLKGGSNLFEPHAMGESKLGSASFWKRFAGLLVIVIALTVFLILRLLHV